MNNKVKIKLVDELSRLPEKQTKGSAKYDAYVRDFEITPDGIIKYFLGFKTEFPSTLEGEVLARSSLSKHPFCVQIGYGCIDSDYRDEWQFRIKYIPSPNDIGQSLVSLCQKHMPYKIGDRCCQISFREITQVDFEQTEELSDTERKGGFGSTGK